MTTTDTITVGIHIPKTAGTTLRMAIQHAIGLDRLQAAYGVNGREQPKPNPLVIFGHRIDLFLANIRERKRVRWFTFVRNPLRRAISAYFCAPIRAGFVGSLDEYLRTVQNPQTRCLRRLGLRPGDLDFTGVQERFQACQEALFNRYGWGQPQHIRENVGDYNHGQGLDGQVVRDFVKRNAADYDWWMRTERRWRLEAGQDG